MPVLVWTGNYYASIGAKMPLSLQPGKPDIAGTREDIVGIARKFREADVEKVITGHCTGKDACAILHEELGEHFFMLKTGSKHSV